MPDNFGFKIGAEGERISKMRSRISGRPSRSSAAKWTSSPHSLTNRINR